MLVNVENFKNLLKKATLNYSIDTFHCDITSEKVTSRMIKTSKDAIATLEFENDIFENVKDEISFNFIEPHINLVPFLNLVDSETIDIMVKNEKIILKNGKQKSNIFFCAEEIPSKFGASEPKGQFKPFISIDLDDEFLEAWNKIKKIGNKFGKIYFNVKNNFFEIETTDKTNKFSNGINFELTDIEYDDCSICFDFANMNNLFNILEEDVSYKLDFIYVKEKEMGMLVCSRSNPNDNSENYYLMSRLEL